MQKIPTMALIITKFYKLNRRFYGRLELLYGLKINNFDFEDKYKEMFFKYQKN